MKSYPIFVLRNRTRGKKGKGPKLIFLCSLWMEINFPYLT